MRNSYSLVLAAFIAVFFSVTTKGDAVLPQNLELAADLVPIVAQLHAQSATFRAQCDRIAQAQNVHVCLNLDVNIRHSCRAFTVITRRRGVLRAEVHVPPAGVQLGELLGHEFEHIVEQIEGLNLRALARVRDSGVREVEFELFETDRAQLAGKTVGEELRLARAARAAANKSNPVYKVPS